MAQKSRGRRRGSASIASCSAWPPIGKALARGSLRAVAGLLIEGLPVIFFADQGTVILTRAVDASGSAWAPPVPLFPIQPGGFTQRPSCFLVGGRPAVAFGDTYGMNYIIWAEDAGGSSWGAPERVEVTYGALDARLIALNGKALILFIRPDPLSPEEQLCLAYRDFQPAS